MRGSSEEPFFEEADISSETRLIVERSGVEGRISNNNEDGSSNSGMFIEQDNLPNGESPLIHHDDNGIEDNDSDGTVILNGDETESEPEEVTSVNNNNTTTGAEAGAGNTTTDNGDGNGSSSASGELSTLKSKPKPAKIKKQDKFNNERKELTVEQRNYIYGFNDAAIFFQKQIDLHYNESINKIQNDRQYDGIRSKIKPFLKFPKFTIKQQAELCNCNHSTFKTTLDKRKLRQNGKSLKRSGRTNKKIPEDVGLQAIEFMRHNPGLKRKDIMDKFNIKAHPRTFKIFLQKHNFKYKGADGKEY